MGYGSKEIEESSCNRAVIESRVWYCERGGVDLFILEAARMVVGLIAFELQKNLHSQVYN